MTKGERLYHHLHPLFITVYARDDVFRTNPFEVLNPKEVAPWPCLTQRCKDSYEQQAVGHHVITGLHDCISQEVT